MKNFSILKRALLALLLLASAPAFAQFKVIGYLPSWVGEVNAVQYDKLTHINYSFLLPNSDGSLRPIENPAKLQNLVATAHSRGVKVLISVGGWMNDGNPTEFISIGNNVTYTRNFATNLVNFATQYNLDGIDIDWEHPTPATANGYSAVMRELSARLRPQGKLLTTAVAGGSWAGPSILDSALATLDFLNIMAYDDTPPNHSSYELAAQSITYWRNRGLSAAKTVLGVPFYGQPTGETFASLLSRGADPNADLFNGIGYNGIPTMKRKTNLAFDQGGGIMIWQLAGDATGANSLLTAINQVVKARTGVTPPPPPPATGVATMYKDCNYAGYAVGLPVGNYTLAQLQSRGILNDDISSLRVTAGYEVQLFNDDNFLGSSVVVRGDNSCVVGINFNDMASSLRVRSSTVAGSSITIQAEAFANMSGVQVENTTDTGAGQNVGYIDTGDWLAYTNVNFPTSGSYLVEYRIASATGGGTVSCDLNGGAIQLGTTTVPGTGGWQTWQTVSRTVNVNAGTYNFGVYAQAGGWNLNWIRITKTGGRSANADAGTLLTVYPNPVVDQLHVSGAAAGNAYRVVNALGQAVANGTLGASQAVNVAALRAGVYTLVITTPDQLKLVSRFTKQ